MPLRSMAFGGSNSDFKSRQSTVVMQDVSIIDKQKIKYILKSLKQSGKNISIGGTGFIEDVVDDKDETKTWRVIATLNKKKKIIEAFVFENKSLGKGAQGEVVLAQNILDRSLVAVKIQPEKKLATKDELDIERRNLDTCHRLIGTAAVFKDTPAAVHYTLMDYYPGESVLNVLYEIDKTKVKNSPGFFQNKKSLDLQLTLRLIISAIQEVIELHKINKLAHRDIKTDNFVMVKKGNLPNSESLKIVDLGISVILADNAAKSAYEKIKDIYKKTDLSSMPVQIKVTDTGIIQLIDTKTKTIVGELTNEVLGTPGYTAPEYNEVSAKRPFYGVAQDLFALGIMIAEIITRNNYQDGLMKKFKEIKEKERYQRGLNIEEYRALFSDLFDKISQNEISEDLTNLEKQYNNPDLTLDQFNKLVKTNLISLVHWLMKEDPAQRPSHSDLESVCEVLEQFITKFNYLNAKSKRNSFAGSSSSFVFSRETGYSSFYQPSMEISNNNNNDNNNSVSRTRSITLDAESLSKQLKTMGIGKLKSGSHDDDHRLFNIVEQHIQEDEAKKRTHRAKRKKLYIDDSNIDEAKGVLQLLYKKLYDKLSWKQVPQVVPQPIPQSVPQSMPEEKTGNFLYSLAAVPMQVLTSAMSILSLSSSNNNNVDEDEALDNISDVVVNPLWDKTEELALKTKSKILPSLNHEVDVCVYLQWLSKALEANTADEMKISLSKLKGLTRVYERGLVKENDKNNDHENERPKDKIGENYQRLAKKAGHSSIMPSVVKSTLKTLDSLGIKSDERFLKFVPEKRNKRVGESKARVRQGLKGV